jgi:hypothetical protein
MATKAPPRLCGAEGCSRPQRAKGLCQMHLKRAQRASGACGQSAGQGPAQKPRPPSARPSISTPSEQGFVHKNQHLTQVEQSSVLGSGITRYQISGMPCPDCDGGEWCFSDQHPTFIPLDAQVDRSRTLD